MLGNQKLMNDSTLLTIKEFAEFTNANQSTLRYYDEIGLLPPAVRGENNYRYYTPMQIFKFNYINVLVDLGVPLSTIKEMNKTRTPESVIKLLGKQEAKLNRRLLDIQKAYAIIHMYRRSIEKGLMGQDGLIRIEDLEEIHYIAGPPNQFGPGESFYDAFIRFCMSSGDSLINLRYPIAGYYDSLQGFLNSHNKPERFISADPFGSKVRPEGKHLVAYRRGYYGDFGDMPQRIIAYIEEHDLACTGPAFVFWLLDEITISDPNQYLMRFSVRVSAKKTAAGRTPK
jgi:DNA-binding transcriptional MerR regulator